MNNSKKEIEMGPNHATGLMRIIEKYGYSNIYVQTATTGTLRKYQIKLTGGIFNETIFDEMKEKIKLLTGIIKVSFIVVLTTGKTRIVIYEELNYRIRKSLIDDFNRIDNLTAGRLTAIKLHYDIKYTGLSLAAGLSRGRISELLTGKKVLNYKNKLKIYTGLVKEVEKLGFKC